jgi:hypothetical protein
MQHRLPGSTAPVLEYRAILRFAFRAKSPIAPPIVALRPAERSATISLFDPIQGIIRSQDQSIVHDSERRE